MTFAVGYRFTGLYAVTVTTALGRFTRAELLRQLARVNAAMYLTATAQSSECTTCAS